MSGQTPIRPTQIDIFQAFENSPEPLDYVWPGLLAGSVGALVAPGGVGKSFWALAAAIAVACDVPGGDILGLAPPSSGRVVYLAAEDPEPVLHHRLHTIGKKLPAQVRKSVASRLSVVPVVGSLFDIADPQSLDIIIELCSDARLLVIDTLSRVHRLDENSNSDMARLVARLEYIAASTGAAVLYLHHVSKGSQWVGQTDSQAAVRGASALVDNARWVGSLSVMSESEASRYAAPGERSPVGDARRKRFVRFATSKQNYGPAEGAGLKWYERGDGGVLVSVALRDLGTSSQSPTASAQAASGRLTVVRPHGVTQSVAQPVAGRGLEDE